MISRRSFMTAASSGTIGVWCPSVFARQLKSELTIGFIHSLSEDGAKELLSAYRIGLIESQLPNSGDIRIVPGFIGGRYNEIGRIVDNVLRSNPNLVHVSGSVDAVKLVRQKRPKIPIIFAIGADPIRAGLIDSFSRPTNMMTGIHLIINSLSVKRLQILSELYPKEKIFGFLAHPTRVESKAQVAAIRSIANNLKFKMHVVSARSEDELRLAFANFKAHGITAAVVASDPVFQVLRNHIARLALQSRIGTVLSLPDQAAAGGLLSYGPDLSYGHRLAGNYAGQVLNGKAPSELPVRQVSKFEFVINMNTAKGLGILIPPELVTLADRLIE